jgi:hypothetical protein
MRPYFSLDSSQISTRRSQLCLFLYANNITRSPVLGTKKTDAHSQQSPVFPEFYLASVIED